MAERPILFSGPLVRAIIAGRKTVTRRLVTKGTSLPVRYWNSKIGDDIGDDGIGGFKTLDWAAHEVAIHESSIAMGRVDQPCTERCEDRDYCCILVDGCAGGSGSGQYLHVPGHGGETRQRVYCRVQPGDELYVRESWRALLEFDKTKASKIPSGSTVMFEADNSWLPNTPGQAEAFGKLRPSIFMPKWASRIRLRVTEVRAERLREIDEAGARAEGAEPCANCDGLGFLGNPHCYVWTCTTCNGTPFRSAFTHLWTEINGKREGASWAENPWLWVYKFEVVEVKR